MYRLTNSTSIIRADGACIPADPSNTDYAAYIEWVAKGNTPEPYLPPDDAQQIKDRISSIERDSLMNRKVREFVIAREEQLAADAGQTQAQLYASDIGYKKIKDIDDQIAELRLLLGQP